MKSFALVFSFKQLRITCFILSILLHFSFLLSAQQNVHFTSLNQSNGLISGDVMCFQQDENRIMWIGTKYGLNVFDGANFNIYGLEDETPFNSDISSLRRGARNEMWIGTLGEGLYVFQALTKEISSVLLHRFGDTILNINCIEFWDSSVWVGTDLGLFKIGNNRQAEFIDLNIRDQKITELTIHANQLAIGTINLGLKLLNNKGELRSVGPKVELINALQSLDSTNILLGTQSSGLLCINTSDTLWGEICLNNPFQETRPIINEIIVDSDENIWVGTNIDGLIKLKIINNELSVVDRHTYNGKKRNTIASNAIFSLYEDHKKNIWIGTIWKGLSIMKHSPSYSEFFYSDFIGEESYPVLSIYKENNELWLGTDGKGLNIININKNTVKKINTSTSPILSGDYVQTIFKDSEEYFWLGTFSSGLTRYNRKTGSTKEYAHSKDNKNSISHNNIREIIEDENSDLWIATWGGGLNQYIRKSDSFIKYSFIQFGEPTNLTDNITSLCFSKNKEGIWIGTFGNGLFYFDIKLSRFSKIATPGFKKLKILNIYPDNKGKLWIGTWGAGIKVLSTLNNKDITAPGLSQISKSRVTSIEEDNFGNIWFSSKGGIYKYKKEEDNLLSYGGFDLITNQEFHINSSFKDDKGNIYFGGIEGVIAIDPSVKSMYKKIEKPLITNINLYNKTRSSDYLAKIYKTNQLSLAYNQNNFTLLFSTPDYPISEVNYSYKLDNYNNTWTYSNINEATFNNLPPGKYAFLVKASYNKMQWSETTSIEIVIKQPLWKRWYAYVAYISLFVVLLFLFQKYTREWEALKSDLKIESLTRDKENELHNIKQRFFTNISHEIRTPITLILGAINRLVESGVLSKAFQKEVEVMQNSSQHLLHLINELLDFRRLESDGIKLRVAEGNFIKFTREIYLSFQTQASANNIDYQFLSRGEDIPLWYDRDQMEKVLYNLISNAFKYTPSGGSITIEIDQDDQHGFLKVIDSGKGIENVQLSDIFKRFYQSENATEVRKSGFGLGLTIAKDIVLLHGGEIDATNNSDRGICISVKIPKGNNHFTLDQQLDKKMDSESIENYISNEETPQSEIDFNEFGDIVILIVEDNNELRDYIKSMFSYNLEVLTADNGEEGLKLAKEHIPDLILSDVMMPVLDGVSMTKAIKSNVKTSHIPIVLLTARTNLIYKKEGFDVGADDYITKPFNETLLKIRVHNILKSRKQLRERLLNEYISKPKEELQISTPDQKFITDLTKVIENNIHENEINAKLISTELCMSHSVVYKKIKALTGLSLIEFIRDFKLKRAALLLSKYQMSVTDVCYKVGFSDRRYFSKLFKSKYGITPSDYIKQHSNN